MCTQQKQFLSFLQQAAEVGLPKILFFSLIRQFGAVEKGKVGFPSLVEIS